MQAYKYSDLYNKLVNEQSSDAFHDKCIGAETYKRILESHPSNLYTPNYFIRIAIGLLTFVAVLFSGGLFALVFSTSGSEGAIGLCIFLAILTYAALELLVQRKYFYNAGVDNLLQWFTLIFIISAIIFIEPANMYLISSLLAMLVCLWLCVRFTDAFMAALSYFSFFLFVFLLYLKLGTVAKLTAPFVMMTFSAGIYVLMNKLVTREKLLLYQFCCKVVVVLTLLTFYGSANYFVVKELSNQMFDLHLALKDPIPYGWILWILTIAIPVSYVLFGMMKKNVLFIRTGLGLAAVSVFTYRYYYAILPVELAMLIAGLILTVVSYALIKYLNMPKYGFSFDKSTRPPKELLKLESVIIAQAFGKKTSTDAKTVEFGGGSFGGGGGGAEY